MFKCDCCGLCCRNLRRSPLYAKLHTGDGICKYLDGNLCSIYEQRPLLCRVEECYEAFFKETLSYDEYLEINYQGCRELKKTCGKLCTN